MSARPEDRAALAGLYPAHVRELRAAYDAALGQSGYAAVVLHSGTPRPRSEFDDQFWPLRLVPHFAHWVPLAWPDCALVVRAGERPTLLALRNPSFWERMPEPAWDHFASEFDVKELREEGALAAEIAACAGTGPVALIAEDPRRPAAWCFAAEDVNPASLLKALDALRTRKTPYEVACISEANRRAALGHRAVAEAFRAGAASELDLHLVFLRATGQDDPETPYKNIVALGPNAAILHHVHYRREKTRGPRSLLLDAGVAVHGYASDVTRTHVEAEGDAAASVFGALVRRMDRMQQALCDRVRLGEPYESLHDEAHRALAAVLRESGIGRGSEEELVASGVTRKLFPHGLGHSLGLQTHDVGCLVRPPRPDNPWLRNTSDVAVGQVFTIEPGIYFIDRLLEELRAGPGGRLVDWSLVEALRPFGGIRIEDDVVVVGGPGPVVRNLTREALPE